GRASSSPSSPRAFLQFSRSVVREQATSAGRRLVDDGSESGYNMTEWRDAPDDRAQRACAAPGRCASASRRASTPRSSPVPAVSRARRPTARPSIPRVMSWRSSTRPCGIPARRSARSSRPSPTASSSPGAEPSRRTETHTRHLWAHSRHAPTGPPRALLAWCARGRTCPRDPPRREPTMAYLEITLNVDEADRPAAAEVYTRYKQPFLDTITGATSKELLVRDEDVQVLHGFDNVANAQAY